MLTALHGMRLALCTLHALPHCTAQVAPCTAHTAHTTSALNSLRIAVCMLHAHTLQHVPHSFPAAHTACTHLTALLTPPPVHNVCMHLTAIHSSHPAPCMPHTHLSLNTTLHDSIPAAHTACARRIVHHIAQLTPPSECALHAQALCTAQLAPCSVHTACTHLTLHTTLHISCFLLHKLHAHTLLRCTAHASHSERAWHTLIAQLAAPTVSSHCTHSPRVSGCRADCQLTAHAVLQACMLLVPHTQRPWCCCSCSRASRISPCMNTGCIHASLSLHTHTSRAACMPTPSVHTHRVAVLLLLHPRAGSSLEATGLQGTCCSLQAASTSPRDQHKPDVAHRARGHRCVPLFTSEFRAALPCWRSCCIYPPPSSNFPLGAKELWQCMGAPAEANTAPAACKYIKPQFN